MKELKYILITLFTALLFSISVSAQEGLYPLRSNPTIKKYLQEHKGTGNAGNNKRIESTSLTLPFVDDFSYEGVYPDANLWMDNYVFVNRDFPVDPPTIGVATFDGL